MNTTSLRHILGLRMVRGVPEAALFRLLQSFGSGEAVLQAPVEHLMEVSGVSAAQAAMIQRGPDPEAQELIDRELRQRERAGVSVVTCVDQEYPRRLKTIHDPPLVLYFTGTLTDPDQNAVAIVGSRNSTPAGRLITEQLSTELAAKGFTIVSGMARGVDAAAHKGAIAASGRTLAVLGCGIDRTYPPEHQGLRKHIEGNGAVLSELPMGAGPHAYHFPRRNRIISGLSLGVVVTQAAARSGSLITARLATEQGREVFAVPGSVREGQSRGPHGLIRQGAKLVETVDDIIEELLPQLDDEFRRHLAEPCSRTEETTPALKEEEVVVYNLLSHDPTSIDDLIVRSGYPASTVTGVLLSMELKGLIRQLPGHCSIRV